MRQIFFLLCLLLLILLPFTVFAQQGLPPVDPASVSGDIAVAGSSILEPVTRNIVTRFTLDGYAGNISVTPNGTDTAFDQLCGGTIDIVLADRQIAPDEVDICTANGRPPIAFRIATGAVVVAVSNDNNYVININAAELQQIFSNALTWSEVRGNWTENAIARYGPATDSSEFALFSNVIFGGDDSALILAVGAQYTDDEATNAAALIANPDAIGFFDANFVLNTAEIRGIALNNVTPSLETIVDNSYPLSRPLFVYTTSQEFSEQPQVASFLNYYLTNIQQEASALGLYSPPAGSLETAQNRWREASGQTALPTATATVPPPVATEETIDPVAATATALAITVNNAPTVAPVVPTADPDASFTPEIQELLVSARLDLELIADERMDTDRPVGWSGSLDIEDRQLPVLVRLDLELLAAVVYGAETRPDDWFGAVNSTHEAIARDIRHDLEILADDIYGGPGRPIDWAGAEPIYRCDRSTQALVELIERNDLYTLTANPGDRDYCEQVAIEISRYVEVNLLSESINIGAGGISIPPDVTIQTEFAVAFFNRSASLRAGVVPPGTGVIPVARSYQTFSNMTLVQGEGFVVFVEWQNLNLTQDQWENLPDESGIEYETSCTADWCEAQG